MSDRWASIRYRFALLGFTAHSDSPAACAGSSTKSPCSPWPNTDCRAVPALQLGLPASWGRDLALRVLPPCLHLAPRPYLYGMHVPPAALDAYPPAPRSVISRRRILPTNASITANLPPVAGFPFALSRVALFMGFDRVQIQV